MKAPWLPVLFLACLMPPLPLHADTGGGFWVRLADDEFTIRPEDRYRTGIFQLHFGEMNVSRDDVDDGEGGTVEATVIFPDDPLKRLVLFIDEEPPNVKSDGKTATVHFSLSSTRGVRIEGAENQWWLWGRTNMADIKPGLTVEELEAAFGGPFEFTGAGFDSAGTVVKLHPVIDPNLDWSKPESWSSKNGTFELQRLISPPSPEVAPSLRLRLEGDLTKLTPEERKTLEGKEHLSSGDPLVRKAQFRLSEITWFIWPHKTPAASEHPAEP